MAKTLVRRYPFSFSFSSGGGGGTRLSVLLLLCMALVPASVFAAPPPDQGPTIVTPHDKVPNLARFPNIYSVRDGNWSNPFTWNLERVPADSDVVGVQHPVTLDTTGAAANLGIYPGGVLKFSRLTDALLLVTSMFVYEGGYLDMGTESDPIPVGRKATLSVRSVALNTSDPAQPFYDPLQWGNGLIVTGKVTGHGARKSPTFVRLTRNPTRPRDPGNADFVSRDPQDPKAGDTELYFERPVTGWQVGDRLIFPDSRQFDANAAFWVGWTERWEQVTVAGISADGLRVSLAQGLQHDHPGARTHDGVLEFLPHVGNLTRNVVIKSQNMTGVRGHVAFLHRAEVDLRYVQFGGLGRSRSEVFDDTQLDANGVATHVGTNQRGRYPVHFRHLIGPTSIPSNGYQYTMEGCSVTCPLNPMPFRWGINIHNSHYGLIKQNVVFNWAGFGIGTEDVASSHNVIAENFVVRTPSPAGGAPREDGRPDRGFGGHSFWVTAPVNYWQDNVGANSSHYAYDLFLGGGVVRLPRFQGADPHQDGQYYLVNTTGTPLLRFSNNETYGSMGGGYTMWDHFPITESVVENFTIWHAGVGLIYPQQNVTYYRLRVLGDWVLLAQGLGAGGIDFGDYTARRVKLQEPNMQGLSYGISPTVAPGGGPFEIVGGYLRNDANIAISGFPNTSGWDHSYRETIIRGVRFDFPTSPRLWWQGGRSNIAMSFGAPEWGNHRVTRRERLFVYDYNGTPADNFELFYYQQAPDALMPGTSPTREGSPELGLTNAENWARYRVAVAGAVAPAGTKSRAGIYGALAPLQGHAPLNLPGLPPVIFDIQSRLTQVSPGVFQAVVLWNTDSPADSVIEDDGRHNASRFTGGRDNALVTAHRIVLNNLQAGGLYAMVVESKNASGTTRLWDRADTTIWVPAVSGDTTAPNMEWPGVSVRHIEDTAASVTWVMNESADSLVEYGLNSSYGQIAAGPNWLLPRPLVRLNGLTPNTTYHFRVVSKDAAGNVLRSDDSTFKTAGAGSDTTAPAVTLTAPTDGDVVSGVVTIRANATDNVGVAGIGISLDGGRLDEGGGSVMVRNWDTREWRDGLHQLTAFAYDAIRNVAWSTPIFVTVNNSGAPLPPRITTEPRDITVSAGGLASFSVGATGSPQLRFQWVRNGLPINGANGRTYSIASASAADAGFYYVVVTNDHGQTQSAEVTLTLNSGGEPPVITGQPESLTVSEGAPAAFAVRAVGTAPLFFQWFKGSTPISGANSSGYTIQRVAAADAGSYSVRLVNAAGEARSQSAQLTVTAPRGPENPSGPQPPAPPAPGSPVITAQPLSLVVKLGTPAAFFVQATGDGVLSYQWMKDNVPIPGATGSSYVKATTKADMGFYSVTVSNATGAVASSHALLQLRDRRGKLIKFPKPRVSAPRSLTVTLGQAAAFAVRAQGPGIFSYQWFKNRSPIPGATSSMFVINPVTAGDPGSYWVRVHNGVLSVASKKAKLRLRRARRR